MKINLANCKTSAQAVTKICYNEETRNLYFRIQSQDLKDLKKCVRIIKEYNRFDWKKVNEALAKYASKKRYFGPGGLNNSKDLLEFEIGREGSPVMYIKWLKASILGMKFSMDKKTIKRYNTIIFRRDMKKLAKAALADECHFEDKGIWEVCRLWWD